MTPGSAGAGFLGEAPPSDDVQRLYDEDVEELGYVMNASRLWAHLPGAQSGLFDLLKDAVGAGSLTFRQRGILVTACASTLGDSYCSLAWGGKLAGDAGADLAGGVLVGDDAPLDATERALARWARTGHPRSRTRPRQQMSRPCATPATTTARSSPSRSSSRCASRSRPSTTRSAPGRIASCRHRCPTRCALP